MTTKTRARCMALVWVMLIHLGGAAGLLAAAAWAPMQWQDALGPVGGMAGLIVTATLLRRWQPGYENVRGKFNKAISQGAR